MSLLKTQFFHRSGEYWAQFVLYKPTFFNHLVVRVEDKVTIVTSLSEVYIVIPKQSLKSQNLHMRKLMEHPITKIHQG
jgi:hypothetical protein